MTSWLHDLDNITISFQQLVRSIFKIHTSFQLN